MCFSAQASFVATITLTAIGIASVRQANRHTVLLACIPLIFALQQFAEGIIWLGPAATPLVPLAKDTFLALAFLVWPLYIPVSLSMIEKETTRKYLILLCALPGAIWALFALYQLLQGSQVSLSDCHIFYHITSYSKPTAIASLYFIATILPFFIAYDLTLKLLGGALALSCAATYFVRYSYFVSIWCFFAALLSLGVYAIVKNINQESAEID